MPTHFAVRACQAGLTREQLVDHFRVHGPDDGSFHTEVASVAEEIVSIEEDAAHASIENLNRIFDEIQDQVDEDLHSLLHASFKTIPAFLGEGVPQSTIASMPSLCARTCCPVDFCVVPPFLSRASCEKVSFQIVDAEPQCSFTDEFLQAVRARNQALEAQDEEDGVIIDPSSLSAQPTFIQHLHAIFEATRPAGPEVGRKIESWYTDHLRRQRCHNARTTILGPDFRTWEQQLRLEWIDQVDPYHDLEFALVHPMPEDAEEGVHAQLLLIQNPDARRRSIVLTIYDSDYDQGLPHSHAVVTTDSVSLQSILIIAEFQEFCPPELPWSECRLFLGDIEVLPHRFIATQHGFAFRLYVKRPQEFDVEALRFAEDDEVRQALAQAFANASHFLPQLASSYQLMHYGARNGTIVLPLRLMQLMSLKRKQIFRELMSSLGISMVNMNHKANFPGPSDCRQIKLTGNELSSLRLGLTTLIVDSHSTFTMLTPNQLRPWARRTQGTF